LLLDSSHWEMLKYNAGVLELVDTGIPVVMGDYYYDYEHKRSETFLVDLNGDGMKDLLFCQQSALDSTLRNWVYRLHNEDYGFGDEIMITDLSGPWASEFNDPKNMIIMDYNGDGTTDLLINGSRDGAPSSARYDYYYFNDGMFHKGPTTNLPYYSNYLYHGLSKVIDINGDGLDDVLYIMGDYESCDETGLCPYTSSMWINTGEGFLGGEGGYPAIPLDYMSHNYYNIGFDAMVMDYNKDGISDLIIADVQPPSGTVGNPPRYEGEWLVYKGRGGYVKASSGCDGWGGCTDEGFEEAQSLGMPFYDYAFKVHFPLVMNLDGDLLPDIGGIRPGRTGFS